MPMVISPRKPVKPLHLPVRLLLLFLISCPLNEFDQDGPCDGHPIFIEQNRNPLLHLLKPPTREETYPPAGINQNEVFHLLAIRRFRWLFSRFRRILFRSESFVSMIPLPPNPLSLWRSLALISSSSAILITSLFVFASESLMASSKISSRISTSVFMFSSNIYKNTQFIYICQARTSTAICIINTGSGKKDSRYLRRLKKSYQPLAICLLLAGSRYLHTAFYILSSFS